MIVCVLNALRSNCRWLCVHICETCSGRGKVRGGVPGEVMPEMTLKELASSGRAGAGVEPECWKPEEQCTCGSRDKKECGQFEERWRSFV